MKVSGGILSTVGGTAAIGIPVTLSSGVSPKVDKVNTNSTLNSGGGDIQVSLSGCDNQLNLENKKVVFGDAPEKNICGNADSSANFEDLTTLFQKEGRGEEQDWNKESGENQGTKSCFISGSSSEGSIMPKLQNGTKYLGFCGNSEINQTKFVKKLQTSQFTDEKKFGTFGVCSNNCGEVNQSSFGGSAEVLEKEKEGNGKEVSFYKNEIYK